MNAATSHQAEASAAHSAPGNSTLGAAMAEYPYAEEEAALVSWQLAQLTELAEIQMGVARKLAGLKPDDAEAAPSERAVQLANAQTRVATSVQKSLALQSKLIEERRQRWLGLEELKVKRRERADKDRDEARSRGCRRLTAIAKDAAHTLRLRDVKAELVRSLFQCIEDKLATDDLYDNLTNFGQDPIGVTLAKLVKSAKLQIDWRLFKDEAWAQAEIEARDPRSPFAFLWAQEQRPPNGRASDDPPGRAGPDPGRPPPA